MFKCKKGDSCIPMDWKCDFDNDCLDKSDELNCGMYCFYNHASSSLIPSQYCCETCLNQMLLDVKEISIHIACTCAQVDTRKCVTVKIMMNKGLMECLIIYVYSEFEMFRIEYTETRLHDKMLDTFNLPFIIEM